MPLMEMVWQERNAETRHKSQVAVPILDSFMLRLALLVLVCWSAGASVSFVHPVLRGVMASARLDRLASNVTMMIPSRLTCLVNQARAQAWGRLSPSRL